MLGKRVVEAEVVPPEVQAILDLAASYPERTCPCHTQPQKTPIMAKRLGLMEDDDLQSIDAIIYECIERDCCYSERRPAKLETRCAAVFRLYLRARDEAVRKRRLNPRG